MGACQAKVGYRKSPRTWSCKNYGFHERVSSAMRFSIGSLLLALAALALGQADERPIRFGRTPSLSPDGSQIAFSYQGNLWTVPRSGGVATRLTASDCLDLNPIFSPDGKWIAFMSNREGGTQVFVIPSQGGKVRQITMYSASTSLFDWFLDSRSLLIATNKYTLNPALYKLDVDSGRLTTLLSDRSAPYFGALSPDGKRFAYYRGGLVDHIRKGYKGSANFDIYVGDVGSKTAKVLWRDPQQMNDQFPSWSGDGRWIYFLRDLGQRSAVVRMRSTGGSPETVYQCPDLALNSRMARNGSAMVFECLNRIHVLDTTSGKVVSPDIYCRTDEKSQKTKVFTYSSGDVQQFAVSPDGKRTLLVIRGELFVVNNERGGEAKRLTFTPSREIDPIWMKDGKSVVFASKKEGSYDLFSLELATLTTKKLTSGAGNEQAPQLSPDGKWIAYASSPPSGIRIVAPDGTGDKEIVPAIGALEFDWAPDSKWIGYQRWYGYWNSDVFVTEVKPDGAPGLTIPISNHPGRNGGLKWFKSGDKVAFISNRYRNREQETLNQVGRFALYTTSLQKEKDTFDFDEDTETPPEKPDPKKPVEVLIDPSEIDRRAKNIYPFFESIGGYAIAPDGTIVFAANTQGGFDFWQMSADGTGLSRLTTGGEAGTNLTWTADGSKLYYLRQGQVRWIGKGGQGRGAVSFDARIEVDRQADDLAVFDEAWTIMNDTFYDKTFRGMDWSAVKLKYREMVPDVSIRNDLNYLITQMLGELNASHTGFSGGLNARPARGVGVLGIIPDEEYQGPGLKVSRVIKRGPASRSESLLKPGDIILEIDGSKVGNGLSFDMALLDKVGKTVVLQVNTVAEATNARKVKIKPITQGALNDLFYEEWIDSRREMVERLSNGRLGYLHVPDMGDAARNRFERELFGFGREKEGMVLDFRFNNGGDTHDSLLQFLDRRKQYLTMVPRREVPTKQPEHIFTKPTIVITDEFSLSDAEVFSMGYQELKIGKVVGRPTMGWIIFTSGAGLLDGSFIRTPYIACLTPAGKDMENWGVPPTIEVYFEPSDFVAGRDPQIERAVRELLGG